MPAAKFLVNAVVGVVSVISVPFIGWSRYVELWRGTFRQWDRDTEAYYRGE